MLVVSHWGRGVVSHQQALRLVTRSLIGLAVSCALVLQLLLAGLAFGSAAAAASENPFVICYGTDGDAGHGPDGKPVNPLHCVIACAQAHGSATATLPASAVVVYPARFSTEAERLDCAVLLPARPGAAHPSQGPPQSA
jgi:hypothetical protein